MTLIEIINQIFQQEFEQKSNLNLMEGRTSYTTSYWQKAGLDIVTSAVDHCQHWLGADSFFN